MNIMRWLIALILLLSPMASFAAELRWKFKEGDAFRASFEQTSNVSSTISATTTEMSLTTGMELSWRVIGVNDDHSAVIEQTIDRLSMTLEMPKTGSISYDSASEEKPTGDAKAIADSVQPLIGAKVKLTMTDRGEITSVELSDEAQKVLDGLADSSSLKRLLSKEGLSSVLRQSIVVLPEQEIKAGAAWKSSAELDTAFGKVSQTTTYTLADLDETVAKIESSSSLELAPTSRPRPTEIRDQSQTGVIAFDSKAGYLRSADIKQELVTTSRVKDTAIQVKLQGNLRLSLTRQ